MNDKIKSIGRTATRPNVRRSYMRTAHRQAARAKREYLEATDDEPPNKLNRWSKPLWGNDMSNNRNIEQQNNELDSDADELLDDLMGGDDDV